MSNSVCLTARQQKFYNYFINFYKSNGCLPTPAQTGRDMSCTPTAAEAVYGALLLKGTFTNGQPLTNTNRARHNSVKVDALNIANFKNTATRKVRKVHARKPKVNGKLAALLVRLLSGESPDQSEIMAALS